MRRIDREIAGERATERLVRGDERAQALIDLAVLALAPLLDRLHRDEPKTHADQRDERQTKQRQQQRLPRAEIDVAHDELPAAAASV